MQCRPCYRWWGRQFCNVCQIFYYRPGQRCLYPFLHTREKYPYNTECIILSIPKRARIKMFRLLLKIIWKKGIPIPTGYILENVWYTENYGVWFQKWAWDELGKLLFLYDFCYFSNAVTEEELRELGRLIRTHREVIKVLGG